ncbi:MAG: trypsin-like peptidase domain-containing protein [Alistipes sp.]|nr:trypsin-like peptidase domain-containing protein [Alistipes sp.]
MNKAFLFLGVLAAGAVAGGATAWSLSRTGLSRAENHTIESAFGRAETDSRFTAYTPERYPDLTYAAEHAVRAVVNIEVVQEVELPQRRYDPFLEFFGLPQGRGGSSRQERRGGGSGVIISSDGYIVTNNHVVDQATRLRVKLNDGRKFDAEVVGTDPATDVALLRIEAVDLPTIPFGSSDQLRLGEWVLAIGSPYDLQSTITAGIVSAKARQLDVIPGEFRIESFIQTDAAVNPGNSGGALVNTRGELVGINTVIKTMTGSYIGYSFAVPETIVRKVVVDLKEYGVVQRALLGLTYRPIDQAFLDEMGEEAGIDRIGGVYVVGVSEEGAASRAGIRKGDVIVSIDGVSIDEAAVLQEQIGKHRPNDKVKLTIKRSGKTKQIEVTLRNKVGKPELLTADEADAAESLGGKFADAEPSLCRRLEIDGGVRVRGIEPGGILARARVRAGFVITHINDRRVRSLGDLRKITDKIRAIDGIYPDGRAASYVLVE